MAIFVDTGDLDEIRELHRMGIVRGVTTNPTILRASGLRGDVNDVCDHARRIVEIVAPLPVSVEVVSNDREEMLDQARTFAAVAPEIVVKVPIHGPEGELCNLEVIHELETKDSIRVNVTAMMSAQQCFLAAMAGATYVSLFGGRVNNMGYDSVPEIERLRNLLDMHQLKGQIIVGSTREVLNIIEWLDAGAHIITVTPKLLRMMLVHPYTKETVKQFLADAEA